MQEGTSPEEKIIYWAARLEISCRDRLEVEDTCDRWVKLVSESSKLFHLGYMFLHEKQL